LALQELGHTTSGLVSSVTNQCHRSLDSSANSPNRSISAQSAETTHQKQRLLSLLVIELIKIKDIPISSLGYHQSMDLALQGQTLDELTHQTEASTQGTKTWYLGFEYFIHQ